MHHLTAADMLNIWEQGLYQAPLQRIVILLTAAFPEMPPDSLLELCIGERDSLLLRLREMLFGPCLGNTTRCPQCGERIEWESKVADFFMPTEVTESFELREAEYVLRFRPPNSLDIAAAIKVQDTEAAQRIILTHCVLHCEYDGKKYAAEELPEPILHKLAEHIEQADPMAEIRLQLICPVCSHAWEAVFDIGSFLWVEINNWAERMLRTVHKLAAGYGWSEQAILALSPVRRQLYLGMLG
jgi:hypothetical protein